MRLSWDLIASTMAVVEHGSFSAAARSLRVTQPTVRRHVEELERVLGVTLFTRSPTGLNPTDAARTLAPYGTEMAALFDALVRNAASDADKPSGTVRLTCSEVLASEVVPQLLEPLLGAHPELQIELVATNRNEDLLQRNADIAIRMMRPTQAGLSAQKVGTLELGLYASRRYLEHVAEPQSWNDLLDRCRLIGEDRSTTILEALNNLGLPVTERHFAFRTDRDAVQLAAIRAGIGIGVCQVAIGDRDERLQRLLPEITSSLDLWLVAHEDMRNQPRIRVVLEHLAAGLRRYGARQTVL